MQIRMFNTVDGSPVAGSNVVPATDISWSSGWNEPSTLSFTVPRSQEGVDFNPRQKLRPWKTIAALIEGDDVISAGPVLRRKWSDGNLNVTVGGGWDLFSKRLVLNRALKNLWVDGEVLVDEDNPAAEWVLQFAGMSLGGIGAALVREALAWGPLAVDPPASEPGTHVRTYKCWDLATTAERLQDLGDVIDGPLIRFDPYLRSDGRLRFRYVADQGAENVHRLSTAMEGHGIVVVDIDEDSDSMATDSFLFGGKSDDLVLAASSSSRELIDEGWPVMQVADTSHSSVSQMQTLMGYAEQITADGARNPESTQLRARASLGIRPGDVIDVSSSLSYYGKRRVQLDVVSVQGDESEWVTVSAFPKEW